MARGTQILYTGRARGGGKLKDTFNVDGRCMMLNKRYARFENEGLDTQNRKCVSRGPCEPSFFYLLPFSVLVAAVLGEISLGKSERFRAVCISPVVLGSGCGGGRSGEGQVCEGRVGGLEEGRDGALVRERGGGGGFHGKCVGGWVMSTGCWGAQLGKMGRRSGWMRARRRKGGANAKRRCCN